MTTGEIVMWVVGGIGAVIIGALIRLRDVLHRLEVRLTRVETRIGLNGDKFKEP